MPSHDLQPLLDPLIAHLEEVADQLRGLRATHGAIDDRWVTAEDAAEILGVKRRWLIDNHRRLPFAKRFSKKNIRFSLVGMRRWAATRG